MSADSPHTPASAADPSMEEILASIRRILSEDDTAAPAPAANPDDVLVLDTAMMVPEATPPELAPASTSEPEPSMAEPENAETAIATPHRPEPDMAGPPMPEPSITEPVMSEPPMPEPPMPEPPMAEEQAGAVTESGLLAPDIAAVAAASIVNMVRTLAGERGTAIHRSGPTIEDLVREELRPLLKSWLDTHLPALVERLVQAEITRVVNRALP